MRSSRVELVSAGVLVTKNFLLEPVLLRSERRQPDLSKSVGNVNVRERSRFIAAF